jgi:hypothetical protein
VPRVARPRLGSFAVALAAGGAVATILASFAAVKLGLTLGVGAVLVAAIFVGSVIAYLRVPHLAVAWTIPLFAFVPALKVFVNNNVGGVKDVVDFAAITAALLIVAFERRRPDPWVLGSVLLFLGLYVINPGHPHDNAWAQGLRLTGEPMLLLLVGFVLPDPRRNLRYAMISLIATGCVVSLYGLLQQALGENELISLGYSYSAQVRTIGSFLRSFGTFDDPFAYAAFVLFALAAVFFWLRRGWIAWATAGLMLLGLGVSFVRTGLLVMIAYIGMQLVRWRQHIPATAFVAAAVVAASLTLLKASGSQTTTLTIYTQGGGTQQLQQTIGATNGQSVFLNGRISAWTAALGTNPADWVFGRGVGKVGTAAARASVGLLSNTDDSGQSTAVDSGYFATMADIGLVGLAVELVIFGRLIFLGVRYARTGSDAGWTGLALIICMLLDALTRASFTGFPTAFLGLLLVGIALAAAGDSPARRTRAH